MYLESIPQTYQFSRGVRFDAYGVRHPMKLEEQMAEGPACLV